MTHPLEASVLRIRGTPGKLTGAAFLVAPGLTVTCAHVITDAAKRAPGQTLTVKPTPPPRPGVVEPVNEKSRLEPESQPMLSDFGLYKCESCGKMVMGFEKENHLREKHGGKSVEWRKVR